MTERTVRVLMECRPAPCEILVHVDANRAELAGRLRESVPGLRVLLSAGRLGPGGSRNFLLREAREELVASFDDDSHPADAEYFATVLEVARRHPEAAVYTATLLDGTPHKPHDDKAATEVATFAGGACVYRRSVFLQTAGYVPLPLAYGMEEVDLSLRLHALGHLIVHAPELRVVHEAGPLQQVHRIAFRGLRPRIVTEQDPRHRDTREIAAGTVANLALLPFLRYPVTLWPYGAAQCMHKVLELMINGRAGEAVAGLARIPAHLWRHRRERSPLPAAQVRSYLKLRRGEDK
jgi:GT2 family glycosyltransferase